MPVLGVLTTCQQMNDAAWRRSDMHNIAAGLRAVGFVKRRPQYCEVAGLGCWESATQLTALMSAARNREIDGVRGDSLNTSWYLPSIASLTARHPRIGARSQERLKVKCWPSAACCLLLPNGSRARFPAIGIVRRSIVLGLFVLALASSAFVRTFPAVTARVGDEGILNPVAKAALE